jgi:hypothetical protein
LPTVFAVCHDWHIFTAVIHCLLICGVKQQSLDALHLEVQAIDPNYISRVVAPAVLLTAPQAAGHAVVPGVGKLTFATFAFVSLAFAHSNTSRY